MLSFRSWVVVSAVGLEFLEFGVLHEWAAACRALRAAQARFPRAGCRLRQLSVYIPDRG